MYIDCLRVYLSDNIIRIVKGEKHMPYISAKDDRREKLRNGESALTAGELNYQIFYTIKHFNENFKGLSGYSQYAIIYTFVKQFLGEKPNYQKYNDMTGALVRCYRECKRRLNIIVHELIDIMDSYDDKIAVYEDLKIKENGDVE